MVMLVALFDVCHHTSGQRKDIMWNVRDCRASEWVLYITPNKEKKNRQLSKILENVDVHFFFSIRSIYVQS